MSLPVAQQFSEMLKSSRHALVTFRKDWNIDAAASALALARALQKRGQQVDVVADGFNSTKTMRFLPGAENIKPAFQQLQKFVISLDVSQKKIEDLSYDMQGDALKIFVTPKAGQFEHKDLTVVAQDFKYDLIITINTPDYASLGSLFTANPNFFYHRPTINIDHEAANDRYGNLNAVDIAASSAAEVLHGLFHESGECFLDEDTATCLLTGVIHKTRSFKSPTVTPRTLDVASELIAAGARHDDIIRNLFRSQSLPTLKLWGRALARLKFDPTTKMVWTLLVRPDFVHAGATDESLEDVLREMIVSAPEAEIAAVLYEQESDVERGKVSGICALISSEQHADATALVPELKPTGDRRLARVCFTGQSLLEAERSVLETIGKTLGRRSKTPPLTEKLMANIAS